MVEEGGGGWGCGYGERHTRLYQHVFRLYQVGKGKFLLSFFESSLRFYLPNSLSLVFQKCATVLNVDTALIGLYMVFKVTIYL